MITWLFVALALCLAYYIYLKGRANENFFANCTIKFSKPKFLFGHSRKMMLRKEDHYNFIKSLYDEFPCEKASGIWDMRTPFVLVRDLQLLKQLTVKEFDHFTDHRVIFDTEMDSLMGNVLVALTGKKWREMRVTLSPAFTGSKMRAMFQLVTEVTGQLTRHLREECEKSPEIIEWDMKDLCSKYTNDVIALCAFGIEVNTQKNPQNDFYRIGRSLMNPSIGTILKFLMMRFFPRVLKTFNIPVISNDSRRFFSSMVLGTMQYRERNNLKRPDMINLLMEAQKGTLHHTNDKEDESAGFATVNESKSTQEDEEPAKRQWTNDEMVAQCLMFFLAGFETSATVMTVAAYELVGNPDIQQKLFEEIRAKQDDLDEAGKEISYETIRELKYLDMVVSETLRKWPPAPVTDRVCTKDFHYKDEETGLEITLEKGNGIWAPIYALQRDAQYFPEPDRFHPERFAEENRHLINPDAYIPFGVGPRSCIANRFALMEVKSLLYHLVLNFELVPTKKTNLPVKVTNYFGAISKDIFLGLKLRASGRTE